MAKTKNKGWVNIYYHQDIDCYYNYSDGPWTTKEMARRITDFAKDPADTIEIQWEEEV